MHIEKYFFTEGEKSINICFLNVQGINKHILY